ncbi:hypothetical protein IX339_001787 [Porphyromonas levii]|uniref:TonB-dependent receptor n=1 Tax=Porphyromonas levii TaxID=28114 RepID=UPI001B8C8B2C|nr:TonB-dependent receptor [Porphyromonas levii]MBR8732318.1 hypothetical protein [Porphyromonas levii]
MKLQKMLFAMLAILLLSIPSMAQVTTSGISGKIVDQNNDFLPGVSITVTHTPSGTVYRTISNAEGYFRIIGMRPGGPYELVGRFLGYQDTKVENINLALGETNSVDIKMNETSFSLGEVTVLADRSSVFNSQRTGAANNFTSKVIESTPMISRSIFDVAKLTPSAISTGNGTSFAGSSNKYNSFQIDGTVNNDVFGLSSAGTNGDQAGVTPISLDAIEEIQVVIAPFDVRQGGFTGGGINAITKSGTNTFHGTAYTYYQNQNLIGKTPGKDVKNRERLGKQNSQTFGFTLGGPIVKNKLFFFTNFEYTGDDYPTSYNMGDAKKDGKKYVASPGVSLITKDEADQVINHLKTLANGYDGGGYDAKNVDTRGYKALARFDWNINDNHKMTLRYNFTKGRKLNFSRGKDNLRLGDNGYYMNSTTHSLVTELQSRFSETISNEFRFGFTRVRDFREMVGIAMPTVSIELDGNRRISFGSEPYSSANELDQDIFTLADNLSLFLGDHTVTIGTHNEFFKMRNLFIRQNTGEYRYSSIADWLSVGTPQEVAPKQYDYSFSDVNGNRRWSPRFGAAQVGLYAQDDWRVSDDFRLTYGLRVDVPIFFDKPSVNEAFNATNIAKDFQVATNQMPASTPLFSPRVGFRWNLNESKASLLRGGVGVFTGRVPFVWISNSFSNTGVEYNRTRLQKNDFAGAIADGFKFQMDPANQYKPSKVWNSEIDVLDKKFKFPQVLRLNLAWEQRLPYDIRFTLEGIYSKTLNNIMFKNLSFERDGQLDNGTGDKRFLYTQRAESKAYNGIIYLTNSSKGYSYNITAKLEKNFDFGLSTMLAYTYGDARAINDGTSSQAYSNWQYNEIYNGDDDQTISFADFNRPHSIIANIAYRVEYAKNFATSVSLFYSGLSGRNYSMVYNGDINGDRANGNDLMYIPTEQELQGMKFVTNRTVKTDPEEQRANFAKWIEKDYAQYRGTYIPRNALMAPFEHEFDFHLAQDFYFNVMGRRNTLQVNFDVMNIGNLINPAWGIQNSVGYNYNPMAVSRKGNEVSYTFNMPSSDTLYYLSDFGSRWKAQIGVKYIF